MLDFGDPDTLETLLDQLDLPALHALSIANPTHETTMNKLPTV